VLLASLAAVSGFVVAGWIGPLLMASIPLGSVPTDFDVRFDWRLLLFTSCISAAAAIIAAIAPVASLMRALRSDTAAILNAHVRSLVRSRRRANRLAIAAQVACALLLLVATASFARTLTNLARIDPGFDPADALAVAIDASGLGRDPKTLPAYYSTLHERLTTSPGIARVSFAQMGLMTRGSTTGAVDIAGWTPVSDADRMTRLFWVGPDFFETAGMRLVAGRSIGTIESAGRERVAVVNQEFARFYFGGPDRALGGTVNGDVRIIGVVADARYSTLRDQPTRAMFLPHTQAPPRTFTTFVIRPSADPSQAAATTMATIRAFDPRLKATLTPISELIAATMSRERFVATIAAVVSIFALFLSCAGLYAAVASSVAERRQEIALRLALGASPRDVVALVVKEPLHVTLLGISVAMPGIYVVMRSVEALLFGVPPFDIGLLTACTTMLAAVAVAATVWPARRALRIAPQESLKSV
jgi:putative ABC transport system permease protein